MDESIDHVRFQVTHKEAGEKNGRLRREKVTGEKKGGGGIWAKGAISRCSWET